MFNFYLLGNIFKEIDGFVLKELCKVISYHFDFIVKSNIRAKSELRNTER